MSLSASPVAGIADEAAGRATYEGLVLGAGLRLSRLSLDAALGAYAVQGAVGNAAGLGDTYLTAEVAIFRQPLAPLGLSLGVRAGFPTGSTAHGLGMGHTMLGPSLTLARTWGPVTALASVTYMRALVSLAPTSHHHHGGAAFQPLVDPHGMSELATYAGASLETSDMFSLRAGVLLAVPIDDAQGHVRVVPSVGAASHVDGWRVSADVDAPVAGQRGWVRAIARIERTWEW